jgi:hypothetical protein
MNERLKELAVQAGAELYGCVGHENICVNGKDADDLMRVFAKLVRQDEREANAKLLNDFAKTTMVPVVDSFKTGLKAGAYAILSRGEK